MTTWEFYQEYWPRLLDGTLVTIWVTAASIVVAVVVAVAMALMKMYGDPVSRAFAVAYIEFFRGTSLLIQLFWIYYVLPLFGLTLEPATAGILGVGLNLGAYGAELVRGGIEAVPKGQHEAALALNMPAWTKLYRIVFPQALLNMLPAWGTLLIELLKGTALVSLITVSDLMFEVKQINGSTFLSAQAFGAALIIYYILGRGILSPATRGLERLMARRMGRA